MKALDQQVCDRARRSRDGRFDGRFFIAVTTTRIYCRPICPARSPKDEHVRYFRTAAEAEAGGFRPCKRCRPDVAAGTPAWVGTSAIVSRALRLIHEGALEHASVEQLADRVGVTSRHLRRLFTQHLGITPLGVARTHAARKPYYAQLCYHAPYDWDHVWSFLHARATPGVESVQGGHYRRTIQLNGRSGLIDVSRHTERPALRVEVRFPDVRELLAIVQRVRRIFDLSANPLAIAKDLSADPLLRGTLRTHPGIRTPGAWDGFEIAVRAILGQQISVRAATTIAGRIASMFGAAASDAPDLQRLFPTPSQLANAPIEQAGVIRARAETIRTLARRVAEGSLVPDGGCDTHAAREALLTIPGIGDWTAQYIAMRAMGEPDAFLSGDLILRRAAGNCTARDLERRSEIWRPWRAYAVMLLWCASGTKNEELRTKNGTENGGTKNRAKNKTKTERRPDRTKRPLNKQRSRSPEPLAERIVRSAELVTFYVLFCVLSSSFLVLRS